MGRFKQEGQYESWWMDSGLVNDETLTATQYTLSKYIFQPAHEDKQRPVLIAVHGYSASTYEWQEFYRYAMERGIFVSLVLLGGHGRSYHSFQKATWQDWLTPVIDEYNTLVKLGYQNISIAAASTGGTLIVEALSETIFLKPPHAVFFIDILMHPRNKLLYMVPWVMPWIGDHQSQTATDEEKKHWYILSPKQSLRELVLLLKHVKKKLKKGILWSNMTQYVIYTSKNDPVVDPVSSEWLYRNITQQSNVKVRKYMLDTDLHVPTRLQGRADVTEQDQNNQKKIFDDILNVLKGEG